jgi:hypothetical protein
MDDGVDFVVIPDIRLIMSAALFPFALFIGKPGGDSFFVQLPSQ